MGWGVYRNSDRDAEEISVTERGRCRETRESREGVVEGWRYNLLWWGSGWRCCDVGRCGMVVLIRVLLVVCKIMIGYLDGTSEHGEWLEGGRWSVYKDRLFGVGWFPFLLSLLVLLYSKASTTLTQPWFLSCLDSLDTNLDVFCPDYDTTLLLPISPTSDPTRYTRTSPLQCTWYWMYCQHCLTPCFDLAWYYCEVTDSYISICYLCSYHLTELHVPTPFEWL